ncbi:unnamed protein product [Allacma fusca]|uniref:F-box domain-containing protein n=1 Tax=Allacma fusca TaxID=39272 RepID=A0A8J2JK61_9HEXA|nr:unnamed protein product [Allacma fusca]
MHFPKGDLTNALRAELMYKMEPDPKLVNHSMSIHLISDSILQYLPGRDVLSYSCVNKLWNAVGRKYMRDKRKCMVEINAAHSCHELRRFANFLASTAEDPPYNGLSIKVSKIPHEDCVAVSMTSIRSFFQTRFPLKFLKIHWDSLTGCVVELFLKEVFNGDVQGLTLSKIPESIGSLKQYFGVDSTDYHPNLPNLKVVKICDVQNHNVIHELISAAPEVKKIVGTVCIEQLQSFMTEGKAPYITDFEFYPSPQNIHLCLQLAQSKPELRSLAVLADNYFPAGRMQIFVETLYGLIGSSAPYLKILNIDQINLIMLSESNVDPFPALHNLQLGFGDAMDEEEGYLSLSRINYDRLFPNLKKVDIDKEMVGTDVLNIYRCCEFWNQPRSTYTCSVAELNMNHSHMWGLDVFRSFATVFPNVKDLHIEFDHSMREFINLLWTNWPEVESITLNTKDVCLLRNMDAVFSGVTSDEALMLSKQSFDFMAKYQFAAVNPCITNLTSLKKIRFNIQNAHSKCRHRFTKSSFLSGLTGSLAFSRMPGLVVELARTDCLRNIRCGFVQQSLLPFVTIFGNFED